jgi:hypothetical protein
LALRVARNKQNAGFFGGLFISDGEEKSFITLTSGRRGLDDKGIVILMLDEKMVASVGRNLVPLL